VITSDSEDSAASVYRIQWCFALKRGAAASFEILIRVCQTI
jgi:hypothetical protein